MKILQVSCEGLGNGGVQAVIMGICRNLPQVHFDILLFTKQKRYYDEEFEMIGGEIFRVPNYEGLSEFRRKLDYYIRFFRIFYWTYKILKKNGPYDAIHCHNYFESGICTLAARLAGVKIRISHIHNTASPTKVNVVIRTYYNIYRKIIKKNSNVKIGCSQQALEFLYGKDKSAFVVNNAIDLNKFDNKKYSYQYHNSIKFIHVGRYCYQKNQFFLLDVFYNIKQKFEDSQLIMIGFGEDASLIAKKIIRLGLEKNVHMLPSDSDVPRLLSEADYMIFPSTYEGLGIVLLEAQVMGIKCFVSKEVPPEANMGLCDYLDLKNGAEFWSDYITKNIISNKSHQRKLVKNNILKKYDIHEICKIYKKIYITNQRNY